MAFTAVSRAPLAKIEAYKKRMGWTFPWVSSFGSDFNFDYHVSFTPEQIAEGKAYFNYEVRPFNGRNAGMSAFGLNEEAKCTTPIPATRGGSTFNGAYQSRPRAQRPRRGRPQFLDGWARRHDEY